MNQRVVKLKDLGQMFFIRMSETSYTGHRRWLTETCRRVGFTPRALEDVEIERTIIKSEAAGLGIALVPDQRRKVPHQNVVFQPLTPTVITESCIVWNADNPSLDKARSDPTSE